MAKGEIVDLPVSDVKVRKRYRQELGDLTTLAESIRELGVLHPIAVTPGKVLIFGERRLRAVADHLDWKCIPARILDIDRLDGEFAENEFTKSLTMMERTAIGVAIEARLGERRGKVGADPPMKGRKTREIAAEKSGFAGHAQYRAAKTVFQRGERGLQQMVDDEVVSPTAGAAVAKLKKGEQRKVVAEGAAAVKAAARRLRTTRKARPSKAEQKIKRLGWFNRALTQTGVFLHAVAEGGGIRTVARDFTKKDAAPYLRMLRRYDVTIRGYIQFLEKRR